MAQHNDLGWKGEDIACDHLIKTGYTIITRNWLFDRYEIDIIAEDEEYIIFVEVKTRSNNIWGNPEEAVSEAKIKRIVEAADFYIKYYDIAKSARFDVIAITLSANSVKIKHFDDAFLPPAF